MAKLSSVKWDIENIQKYESIFFFVLLIKENENTNK